MNKRTPLAAIRSEFIASLGHRRGQLGCRGGQRLDPPVQEADRGRHPAALNFGDCCTYAVASVAGEPLLCTADDFARTDLLLVSLDNDENSADAEQPDETMR